MLAGRRAERLFDLAGRTALVTGAGQGVGAEIALTLAAQGATLVINDYRPERADGVARQITANGGAAIAIACDVSDYEAVTAMVEDAERQAGAIDILVNNAGNGGAHLDLCDRKPFWQTGPDDWQQWIGVNLNGVMNSTRSVMAGMIARRHGRLITIISDAGRCGEPLMAAYSAAKAGAAGFMRAMARAGGTHGVTANCISLAGIDTPGARTVLVDEDMVRKMLRHYVVPRIGQPADAAAMALYLASDAAEWVTGQTYPVNGGYSLSL